CARQQPPPACKPSTLTPEAEGRGERQPAVPPACRAATAKAGGRRQPPPLSLPGITHPQAAPVKENHAPHSVGASAGSPLLVLGNAVADHHRGPASEGVTVAGTNCGRYNGRILFDVADPWRCASCVAWVCCGCWS